MPTYIQGSDVFTYLRGDALQVVSSFDGDFQVFAFSGTLMIGDKARVTLVSSTGADYELIEYTAIGTDLTAFMNALTTLIEVSGDYEGGPISSTAMRVQYIGSGGGNMQGGMEILLTYQVIACSKSDVMNLDNEMVEITQDSQIETEWLPTFQSRNISIEQAIIDDATAAETDTITLARWAKAQTLLYFKYEMPNMTEYGQCYIKSFNTSGGVNTGALCNFEMIVTGTTLLDIS